MNNNKKKRFFEMAYASSLGIAMAIAIFGCLLIGNYLDRKFNTGNNVFTALFLVIGILAGFRNFYVFIKRFFDEDEEAARKVKENGKRKKGSVTKKN
jgi:ATP synthase protein I